ncbi:protein bark beetle-like isoform X2 [Mya arenaria]|uniref:protein bark beetle-like isoform X2 n=1 Tax=Mya arenaria TaxID=6604 RepID=UPI0022E0708C|nr:protein bark beetle-like isoform X2 [Mya arenaria]
MCYLMKSCALLLVCVTLWYVTPGEGQITPPPPSKIPFEANGRLYNIFYVPEHCKDPFVMVQEDVKGGVVIRNKERKVLMKKYGPYHIQGNLELEPQACMVIMPGVKMYFDPGFGIIVNGTLIARGSYIEDGRILMTKNPNATDYVGPNSPWPTDARLVDGNTTRDGRLDLLHQGTWRGVCTNYNNFTAIDLNVTCRHLGFVYGNFTYHSFSRNETDYMLYEKPSCRGDENSLFACPGAVNIKFGKAICDGQQVIGFQCAGLRPDLAKDHWRGIEIYNATVEQIYDTQERLRYNKTYTFLEYLDIEYAGLDIFQGDGMRRGFASISASPFVPIMNNITVSHGAYDGLNLTDIRGDIHMANSTVSHNRGHGVFIKTAVGRTLINMTDIQYNWGDGLKMYMANYTIDEFNRNFPSSTAFCRLSSQTFSSFPILLHQDLISPVGDKPVGDECSLSFRTADKKVITLHTLIMERDPEASGLISIHEGSRFGEKIYHFQINNGTFPQSITTKTDQIYIHFNYIVPDKPPSEIDPTKRCKHQRSCIRFLFELTTDYGPDTELRLYNASVSNNTGYGVNIQEVRSKVSINSSVISDNGYGAGLRVYQGAAEVAINSTKIERNMKAGVNITYSGGYQLVNVSTISENYGYGIITEYLLLNRTRIELVQKIEVVRSVFMLNEWTAFRIGNYCLGGHYLFNESYFGMNKHEAIEYLSCNISTTQNTNFSMAYNEFIENKRHAVLISPLVNTVGIFTNNTFKRHKLGVLRLDNGYDFIENRWYKEFEVGYKIYENKFSENTGRYVVNFRLSEPCLKHKIEFKFNTLVENTIVDPFVGLNPRSNADAVIVVSSGNVFVQRNYINNPNSVRDIATHLVDPSVIILANYNWWGTYEHKDIYPKIFDQNNRFNLAEIKYHPVLMESWLYGPYDTSHLPEFRWPFERNNRIGGVLEGYFKTSENRNYYIVDRDIIILKDAFLEIRPGTTLEFMPSIGMVIHGRLKADGVDQKFGTVKEIKFKLYEADFLPMVNRTSYEYIRLVDGATEFEGRLELNFTGEFGTVCSEGWTEQNSALACQQLGLTFNPEYGTPSQIMFPSPSVPILMSHVSCDQLDTDMRECRALHEGEFVCDHTKDVFLRCQPPTWSGITMTAQRRYGTRQTEETQIRYVTIEKAGLLDFVEMSYTPGLRIDYNFYKISYLTIRDCVSDGINIKYANPFSKSLIEKVTVENSLGNGILTRSPFLELSHLTLTNNAKAGFVYDPMFTEYEALSVRNFIGRGVTEVLTDLSNIQLSNQEMKFLITTQTTEDKTYTIQISTADQYSQVVVQVLDYNPQTDKEKVVFYQSDRNNWASATKSWSIEEDLVDFPLLSKSQYLTIRYTVRGTRSGRLALAIISNGFRETYDSNIIVYNATIKNNERGVMTKHYNNPSNEKMEIFHRAKKELIRFEYLRIEGSREEAMFIPSLTKYHENFIPTMEEMTRAEKVGEIKYEIVNTKIINNKKGIHAEHNHVDFANNVWKWNISNVEITLCESGGFIVELPRVNDLYERQIHAVNIEKTNVFNNKRFGFGVIGYFADVRIVSNSIHDNECLNGLVTLSGMEKDIYFYDNRLENNRNCKYALDFNLMSHSEYKSNVSGLVSRNYIVGNTHSYVAQGLGTTSVPVTYAVAVKGVQNITFNKNVLDNGQLQYELVAGVTSLILDNKLNAKENYWGTTDQFLIKKRIFDFDDWNNFAIAEYFPFLAVPNPIGNLATDTELVIELDLNHLGGRIEEDYTIPARSQPYIVYSDITVMPGVKFTIPPGTELQFYPNVGILVLGQLIATGAPYSRIKFTPARPDSTNVRAKRQAPYHPESLTASDIHFVGGQNDYEGFLELYNASSRSWNIMCDSQFNEKTAEVVCRSLGLETVNVDVRFTPLYDFFVYGKPMYFLKEFWTYSYYCKGNEDSLDYCMKRINYNIKPCIFAGNFTFIRCGLRNLPAPLEYWGNIRFAPSEYEEEIYPFIDEQERSRLQYVDIDGAGMLHGEKAGAIQTTYVNPILDHINITRCVLNGIDLVAPRHDIDIEHQNVSGNLGYAINFLVLNGDSMASPVSSFHPLVTNTVPYNLYGLVDICKMEKVITVENRLVLFYKYSPSSMDCVKIIRGFSSQVGPKPVALRFLQFHLYQDDFYRNLIEIFDGGEITVDNNLVTLTANSSQEEIKTQFRSSGSYLTIHIHASPSYGFYGFVAEVVTLPMSGLTYPDDDIKHRVRNVIMKGNEDGALMYMNVGDITPSVYIDHCWIEGNGVGILNLTSPPIIDVGLQSTREFNLQNSFIARNKGGTYIRATTPSAATKLRANITNNVFAHGTHGEVLNLTGHHYEKLFLYENYIYNNSAGDYRDIIHVQNVVVNFTFNTVTNNTGHYIVRLYNKENTEATQEYTKSLFYGNNATAVYRALFHVGSGNPKINNNYMVNTECDFELETNPVNKLPNGQPGNAAPIDARENWWGSYSTGYVNGKIWDRLDNDSLVAVTFMPMKVNNESLVYGKCAPGWYLEDDRCYKYMGAALPYKEANDFCIENGGFLADAKGKHDFFRRYLRLIMNVYAETKRVWVYSEVTSGRCSAFEKNYVVEEYDCFYVMHPFLCEKDPYIQPPGASIYTAVIAIGASIGAVAIIAICILVILWRVKSTKRKDERFERQASIRSSIKGSTIKTRSQYSLSSSKFLYDQRSLAASQISIGGITEDETSTDPHETRRRLRQRAEIARGRQDNESPRYDRHDFTNGNAKGRQPYRSREFSEASETDYEYEKKREAERDRPRRRAEEERRHHTNGGYKHSDESHDHEQDSDDDVKVPFGDSDDDTAKNSFTPVKFKRGVEKELDSIQMNGSGNVQYIKQDDTGSVDLSGGRHLSRSMSSFSAHDAQQSSPSRSGSEDSNIDTPAPPLPMAMNIPAKIKTPKEPKPVPKPVPLPRARPLPSARSYGSKEDLSSPREPKLNNLSQDEASDYRGSRERLDNTDSYMARKPPSYLPQTKPMSRSREKLDEYQPSVQLPPSVDAGVDFLPRRPNNQQGYDPDRESPMLHSSRENLLPKRQDSDNVKPTTIPAYEPLRATDYPSDYYGQPQAPRYPNQNIAPGVDYMGNRAPQNNNYNDLAPGTDYLPQSMGMPMKNRHMIGQRPSVGTSNSDYESYDGGQHAPPPSAGPRLVDTTPGYYDYSQQPQNYPTSMPPESGTDYMPRNQYNPSPQQGYMARSRDNVSRSRDNVSRSRDNVSRSRENLSRPRDNVSRSRENLSRSRENIDRSRDNISRSRDNLRSESDFAPYAANYDDGMRENSRDFEKPRQQKSIETEI